MSSIWYSAPLNDLLDTVCDLVVASQPNLRCCQPPFYTAPQDDGSCEISASLPGVTREHVSISVQSGVLSIDVDTGAAERMKAAFRGTLRKRYRLSDTLSSEDISASMKDGVLRVVIKAAQKSKSRTTIEIL